MPVARPDPYKLKIKLKLKLTALVPKSSVGVKSLHVGVLAAAAHSDVRKRRAA